MAFALHNATLDALAEGPVGNLAENNVTRPPSLPPSFPLNIAQFPRIKYNRHLDRVCGDLVIVVTRFTPRPRRPLLTSPDGWHRL